MTAVLLFLAMVIALAVAAFCAGAEIGFVSVNRGRVLHLSREGSKAAKIVEGAIANMSATLTTLLIGNNLAAVVFSSASAELAARLFPESAAARSAWTISMAFIVLYLSEFLPKLFCAARPLRRIVRMARAFEWFALALRPLTRAALAVTSLSEPKEDSKERITTRDLVRILQDRKDGVKLTDFESALISRILVIRRKGEPMTVDSILHALDDD